MLRALILADTHIPDFARTLPRPLLPHLRRADVIVHAGDVTSAAVLDELAAHAPVHVARGNNDGPDVVAWGGREELRLDLGGLVVAVVHDSGPRVGRVRRLMKRFPDAGLIVFGHSHIPIDAAEDGVRFLNPGSPTWKRRQPRPTFGLATVSRGQLRTRIVAL